MIHKKEKDFASFKCGFCEKFETELKTLLNSTYWRIITKPDKEIKCSLCFFYHDNDGSLLRRIQEKHVKAYAVLYQLKTYKKLCIGRLLGIYGSFFNEPAIDQ